MASLEHIKITSRDFSPLESDCFFLLLENTHVLEDPLVASARESGFITLTNLKTIATKSGIPYPLFFANKKVVQKQIKRSEKIISQSGINPRGEVRLNSRGAFNMKDVYLLVKDLRKKQRFLSERLVKNPRRNSFVCSIAKDVKQKKSVELLVKKITEKFKFNSNKFRTGTKTDALAYLVMLAESMNILVSRSIYNYMAQNIPKSAKFSGFCMKDNYYPLIFINTKDNYRDGDETTILEPVGRQSLTLMTMLICIAANEFRISNFDDKTKNPILKMAFGVASEILIPKSEVVSYSGGGASYLKDKANEFNITPSMYLYRLLQTENIDTGIADKLFEELKNGIKKQTGGRGIKHDHRKYLKYNGHLYSAEIFKSYAKGRITQSERNIALFRKNKFTDTQLVRNYRSVLKIL